jgi:VanZ family protein
VTAPPRSAPRFASPAALRAWLLVSVWLALIFTFSSDLFGASSTGSLLRPILRWLFPAWSPAEIASLHFAIRKAAHLSVYGVLALLGFRALRLSLGASARRHASLALALVLVVASIDEYHQSFSSARTGTVKDVGYDLAGALAALALCALASAARRSQRRPSSPL